MFKKTIISLFLFVLITGLTACSIMPQNQNVSANLNSTSIGTNQNLPQQKVQFTNDEGKQFVYNVEVASTFDQRQVGLMNREKLDQDKGMLFIFDKNAVVFFWMKNTLIPLDIVFVDQNFKIKQITHNAQPCLETDDSKCEKFNSIFLVKYVVELNAGETEKNNIKTGDSMLIMP